ncbi:hypothetical protein, partial [Castellaniella sp.]
MSALEMACTQYRALRLNAIGHDLVDLVARAEAGELSYLDFAHLLAESNRSARGVIPWPCFTSETTRHDQQGGRSGRWTDREQTSSGA